MTGRADPAQSERRVRRVLRSKDPREADLLAARAEVESIRSEMSRLRHRLYDLSKVESLMEHDSIAAKVNGSLTLSIMALYTLVDGSDRSFQSRAARSRELWADVEANPDAYVIEPGTSREAMRRGR